MDRHEKKEWLSRAYNLDRRLRGKIRRFESLSALATRTTASYDCVSPLAGFATSRLESYAVMIADLGTEISADTEKLRSIKEETQKVIHGIGDALMENILELRYLDMMQWEEIAAVLGLSTNYVYQLHMRALDKLQVN